VPAREPRRHAVLRTLRRAAPHRLDSQVRRARGVYAEALGREDPHLADRDPDEARTLLDPVLEHMMEAVHRYEGPVHQVVGDGIMALVGAPLASWR
jgi:class 3 adenylate cyclase